MLSKKIVDEKKKQNNVFYKELTPDKRVLGTIGLTAPLRNCNIRYLVPCLYMNMVQGLSRNEHNATVIMCV